MNANDLRNEWVAALRSGKYVQGEGQLMSLDSRTGHAEYCCLGVAADILVQHGLGEWDENILVVTHPGSDYSTSYETELGSLGSRMFMLRSDGSDETTLIAMNDEEKASFEQIADWIEMNA